MLPLRILVRFAGKLQNAWNKGYQRRVTYENAWNNADFSWTNLNDAHRQLGLSAKHGLYEARSSVQTDFRWKLDELLRQLQSVRDELTRPRLAPKLADLVCELQSLDEEFGNLSVDAKLGIVRVQTEPITLTEIELGPFSIELHWSRFGNQAGSSCFDFVAVEPNPASSREEVIHPHVSGRDLCAGDAAGLIVMALAEGRVTEAFLLIRSVLTTYNPRSAYVQLEEWDGLSCGDCGGRMHRDHTSFCDGCHHDLCEGCASSCRSCDGTRCTGCLDPCDGCSDHCCANCLELIPNGDSLCSSCCGICASCDKVLRQSQLDESGCCPECAEPEEPAPNTSLEVIHAS